MASSPKTDYAEQIVRYGRGKRLGTVENKEMRWLGFMSLFVRPPRGPETLKQFLKMTEKEQRLLKNRKGYFFGGHSLDGHRRKTSIEERSFINLDLEGDYFTPAMFESLRSENSPLGEFEYFVHTSRKHRPEEPRTRVIILPDKPIPAGKYTPVSRILASLFDPTLRAVDSSCYREAQMVFAPTLCADSEFIFHHNPGQTLDWSALLNQWEADTGNDSNDWSTLPRSSLEKPPRKSEGKAQDPTEKRGIIGRFCRVYGVEEAIAEFELPYTRADSHGGEVRYHYDHGSGDDGMVVYGDNLFAYSFHTTDRAAGRLLNAFDLVRIHKFGELDEGLEDERPTALPSYQEMARMLEDDPNVEPEDADRDMFDELGDEEPETDIEPDAAPSGHPLLDLLTREEPADDEADTETATDDEDEDDEEETWTKRLRRNEDGRVKADLYNLVLILRNDVRVCESIAYNEHLGLTVFRKPFFLPKPVSVPFEMRDSINGDLWNDEHTRALRLWLEMPKKAGWNLKFSVRDLEDGISEASRKNGFHPIREYLDGLTWDGVSRCESLWHRYVGAPDDPYHRETARKWMIAAVGRAFEPGMKFDFAPIFEGIQGKRKSTFIRALAKHEVWFGPLRARFDDEKALVESMQGKWIMEIPELSTIHRSEIEDVKAFMSEKKSVVRLAWGRRAGTFYRGCVFAGSTNKSEYLRDDTGNRRWWPIYCAVAGEIDTDGLLDNLDQLWAEATALYHDMRAKHPHGELPLYLDEDGSREGSEREQERRRIDGESDLLRGEIELWLDTAQRKSQIVPDPLRLFATLDEDAGDEALYYRTETCVYQIWVEALDQTGRPNYQDSLRISDALAMIPGWEKTGERTSFQRPYGRQRAYRRTGPLPDEGMI